MKTQQLFTKYILLSEEKEAKKQEYNKLMSELNTLISAVPSSERNRTLEKLEEISQKRACVKLKEGNLAMLCNQLDETKKEILALLEGMDGVTFQVGIKIKKVNLNYLIKCTESDIAYALL